MTERAWPAWSQGSKDPCDICGVSGHRCPIDTQQAIEELEFGWRYEPDDVIKRSREEDNQVFNDLRETEAWGP